MKPHKHSQQRGLSLVELLVSITLFAIVSAAAVTFMSDALRRMSLETKASLATKELKNAVALMQSELRMSAAISPYNVGIDANLVTCRGQLATTPTSVRFLITHDDPSAPSGMQVYYVGYEYSVTDDTLYRGEVAAQSTTSCTLPVNDPLQNANKKVLARHIVRIDGDNDGIIDAPFTRLNNQLFIRLGALTTGSSGLEMTQNVTGTVYTRAL
jgi:prepilin-type N-terminal cleavage/methylation domain-containing protein